MARKKKVVSAKEKSKAVKKFNKSLDKATKKFNRQIIGIGRKESFQSPPLIIKSGKISLSKKKSPPKKTVVPAKKKAVVSAKKKKTTGAKKGKIEFMKQLTIRKNIAGQTNIPNSKSVPKVKLFTRNTTKKKKKRKT